MEITMTYFECGKIGEFEIDLIVWKLENHNRWSIIIYLVWNRLNSMEIDLLKDLLASLSAGLK